MADNNDLENILNEIDSPPIEEPKVDQTKAFAKRLAEEKAKLKEEIRLETAKSLGYNSWDEYVKESTDNKLINNGLDPETARTVFKDMMKSDPEYQEAISFKKKYEEEQAVKWANDELSKLNVAYGTQYKDISELGENVVNLWKNGISLEKAYAVENLDKIKAKTIEKINKDGKEHLVGNKGNGTVKPDYKPTNGEIGMFKKIMPYVSEDKIIDFLKRAKN